MKKKILVIEDETIFCKLISRWLENNGYKVFTAPDGEAGLEIIKEEKPDLLLVDTLLPGMDGLQLSREIRCTDLISDTPIILMSAIYKDLHFVMQAKKIANDFIEKPFKEMELIRKIHALLPQEDDVVPLSPSYMVSVEAEKSKKISDQMETNLVVGVKEEKEIIPEVKEVNINLADNESKSQQGSNEDADSTGEFHIDLPDTENKSDEKSNEDIKISETTQRPIPNQKKSQSMDSIQKELDDLFNMTKKK